MRLLAESFAPVYFTAAMVRTLVWATGVYLAVRAKRALASAGFSLLAISSFLFAIENSNLYHEPDFLYSIAIYSRAPASVLIVGSFALGTYLRRKDVDKWDW